MEAVWGHLSWAHQVGPDSRGEGYQLLTPVRGVSGPLPSTEVDYYQLAPVKKAISVAAALQSSGSSQ